MKTASALGHKRLEVLKNEWRGGAGGWGVSGVSYADDMCSELRNEVSVFSPRQHTQHRCLLRLDLDTVRIHTHKSAFRTPAVLPEHSISWISVSSFCTKADVRLKSE